MDHGNGLLEKAGIASQDSRYIQGSAADLDILIAARRARQYLRETMQGTRMNMTWYYG